MKQLLWRDGCIAGWTAPVIDIVSVLAYRPLPEWTETRALRGGGQAPKVGSLSA
jgi:hypothetical protein